MLDEVIQVYREVQASSPQMQESQSVVGRMTGTWH
jgi:hypothetical protein